MSLKTLNPYLNFNGNAADALSLYEKALGAKVENLMRFSDAKGMPVPPGAEKRIMHCKLRIDGQPLMLSDAPPDWQVKFDGNVQVSLDFTDPVEMARKFEALSTGGTITLPLHDAFWGAKFGMLTDAVGVRWIFNCEVKQ